MTTETSNARGEVNVGDRVRAKRGGSPYYRNGDCGTVLSIDPDGYFWVRWDNPIVPESGHGWCIHPDNCALAAPPPADPRSAAEQAIAEALRRERMAPDDYKPMPDRPVPMEQENEK